MCKTKSITAICYIAWVLLLLLAIVGSMVSDYVGRRDLSHKVFVPGFCVLLGTIFITGALHNHYTLGVIYLVQRNFLGKRKRTPMFSGELRYYAALATFIVAGVGITLLGIWLAFRDWFFPTQPF